VIVVIVVEPNIIEIESSGPLHPVKSGFPRRRLRRIRPGFSSISR